MHDRKIDVIFRESLQTKESVNGFRRTEGTAAVSEEKRVKQQERNLWSLIASIG